MTGGILYVPKARPDVERQVTRHTPRLWLALDNPPFLRRVDGDHGSVGVTPDFDAITLGCGKQPVPLGALTLPPLPCRLATFDHRVGPRRPDEVQGEPIHPG
jgi:hypothetical protein